MWQSIVVLILIALVSIYVARHFFRVAQGRKSHCGCCSECQGLSRLESLDDKNRPDPERPPAEDSPSGPENCCGERS
jgi:hypothetical protein